MKQHQRIGLSLLIFGAAGWIEFEADITEALSMVVMFIGNFLFLVDKIWEETE